MNVIDDGSEDGIVEQVMPRKQPSSQAFMERAKVAGDGVYEDGPSDVTSSRDSPETRGEVIDEALSKAEDLTQRQGIAMDEIDDVAGAVVEPIELALRENTEKKGHLPVGSPTTSGHSGERQNQDPGSSEGKIDTSDAQQGHIATGTSPSTDQSDHKGSKISCDGSKPPADAGLAHIVKNISLTMSLVRDTPVPGYNCTISLETILTGADLFDTVYDNYEELLDPHENIATIHVSRVHGPANDKVRTDFFLRKTSQNNICWETLLKDLRGLYLETGTTMEMDLRAFVKLEAIASASQHPLLTPNMLLIPVDQRRTQYGRMRRKNWKLSELEIVPMAIA